MMSTWLVVLVSVTLSGWTSALPMTRSQRDVTENTIEIEEDPAINVYFDLVDEIMELARGKPSFETGARLAEYNPKTDPWNPEELGSYYEGDILLPDGASDRRNGLLATSTRWPGGVIPVKLDVGFNFGVISQILYAIGLYYLNVPCIRFVPWVGQTDYIHITSLETGCWSSVGRTGGEQKLNLQTPGCTTNVGTILHELMHATGFLHEQSRSDRDEHVTIRTENILPGREGNFVKSSPGGSTFYNVPYNYQSVMHYSSTAFSKNGEPTIVGKPDATVAMGQRVGFAPTDVTKLRAMYGCPVAA